MTHTLSICLLNAVCVWGGINVCVDVCVGGGNICVCVGGINVCVCVSGGGCSLHHLSLGKSKKYIYK